MGGIKDGALRGREVLNPPWLGAGGLTASDGFLATLIYIRSDWQVGLGKPHISFFFFCPTVLFSSIDKSYRDLEMNSVTSPICVQFEIHKSWGFWIKVDVVVFTSCKTGLKCSARCSWSISPTWFSYSQNNFCKKCIVIKTLARKSLPFSILSMCDISYSKEKWKFVEIP